MILRPIALPGSYRVLGKDVAEVWPTATVELGLDGCVVDTGARREPGGVRVLLLLTLPDRSRVQLTGTVAASRPGRATLLFAPNAALPPALEALVRATPVPPGPLGSAVDRLRSVMRLRPPAPPPPPARAADDGWSVPALIRGLLTGKQPGPRPSDEA